MIGGHRTVAWLLWMAVGLCIYASQDIARTVLQQQVWIALAGVFAIMSVAVLLDALVESVQKNEERRQAIMDAQAEQKSVEQRRAEEWLAAKNTFRGTITSADVTALKEQCAADGWDREVRTGR